MTESTKTRIHVALIIAAFALVSWIESYDAAMGY